MNTAERRPLSRASLQTFPGPGASLLHPPPPAQDETAAVPANPCGGSIEQWWPFYSTQMFSRFLLLKRVLPRKQNAPPIKTRPEIVRLQEETRGRASLRVSGPACRGPIRGHFMADIWEELMCRQEESLPDCPSCLRLRVCARLG